MSPFGFGFIGSGVGSGTGVGAGGIGVRVGVGVGVGVTIGIGVGVRVGVAIGFGIALEPGRGSEALDCELKLEPIDFTSPLQPVAASTSIERLSNLRETPMVLVFQKSF